MADANKRKAAADDLASRMYVADQAARLEGAAEWTKNMRAKIAAKMGDTDEIDNFVTELSNTDPAAEAEDTDDLYPMGGFVIVPLEPRTATMEATLARLKQLYTGVSVAGLACREIVTYMDELPAADANPYEKGSDALLEIGARLMHLGSCVDNKDELAENHCVDTVRALAKQLYHTLEEVAQQDARAVARQAMVDAAKQRFTDAVTALMDVATEHNRLRRDTNDDTLRSSISGTLLEAVSGLSEQTAAALDNMPVHPLTAALGAESGSEVLQCVHDWETEVDCGR